MIVPISLFKDCFGGRLPAGSLTEAHAFNVNKRKIEKQLLKHNFKIKVFTMNHYILGVDLE